MKVSVTHQGRLYWLAQNNLNQVYFLSEREADAIEFQIMLNAIQALESRSFFDIPRHKFRIDTGKGIVDLLPKIGGILGIRQGEEDPDDYGTGAEEVKPKKLKPYQEDMLKAATSGNQFVQDVLPRRKKKVAVLGPLPVAFGKKNEAFEVVVDEEAAKVMIDEINEYEANKPKRIKPSKLGTPEVVTGKGSQRTNDEAVDQVAAYYGLKPEEVHQAIQKQIKGGRPDLPEAVGVLQDALCDDSEYWNTWKANIAMPFFDGIVASGHFNGTLVQLGTITDQAASSFLNLLIAKNEDESVPVANIDDQFCLAMSEKIKAFILDPARRNLIGITSIEKESGVPSSTISNYIHGKRERIALHNIGPIVKVLQVLGFKA